MSTTTLIQVPEGGAKVVPGQPAPDNPIVPFIEGDGIGVDITPVMKDVVDAAVAKAYDGAREIHWMEIFAGEKSTRVRTSSPIGRPSTRARAPSLSIGPCWLRNRTIAAACAESSPGSSSSSCSLARLIRTLLAMYASSSARTPPPGIEQSLCLDRAARPSVRGGACRARGIRLAHDAGSDREGMVGEELPGGAHCP